MPSSRETSPEVESGSPLPLTPRSKVKALLAKFDDDSEEEEVSGATTARERLRVSLLKNPVPKPDGTEKQTEAAISNSQNEVEESSDEEEVIQPRGRMAARMMAANANAVNEEKSIIGTAEIAKSTSPKSTTQDSEESDAPVISRKRKLKVARRATPSPSPTKEPASPGLFVSPAASRSKSLTPNNSESDALPDLADARFQALVAKKRKEREEKEAEAAAIKANKMAERKRQSAAIQEDDDVIDDEVERRLTQSNPPTRKASKKALDDIHRETQRLSRSNQLAHAPITKKKFTVADFTKRFNYKQPAATKEEPLSDAIIPTSSPARYSCSDVEMHDTPATTPGSVRSTSSRKSSTNMVVEEQALLNEQGSKSVDEPFLQTSSSPLRKMDKGKGKAIANSSPLQKLKKYPFQQSPVRVSRMKILEKPTTLDESDSDLEIIKETQKSRKTKLDSIFDRLPEKQAQEPHSLHIMKMLAHINSPDRKNVVGRNKKPTINNAEWQISMQQRAKQQARQAREEKLQMLREKGIHIQTAEEKENEMAEVENLIARARREAEEIMQRERAAAKKERKANGEADPLGENSSDDEDYEEEENNLAEEISGSEADELDSEEDGNVASGEEDSEMDEDLEMEDEDEELVSKNPMLDNVADDTENDETEDHNFTGDKISEINDMDEDEDEDGDVAVNQKSRRSRQLQVISDDEDMEDSVMETPSIDRTVSPRMSDLGSPAAPMSVLRSATKTFIPGVTVAGPAGLGLTQIFAGTMDESQVSSDESSQVSSQIEPQAVDSMGFLRRLPAPELPPFVPTPVRATQDLVLESQPDFDHIPESQPLDAEATALDLGFSQSQIHGFDSFIDPSTQMSDFPEATQDVGFQHMTPIKGRFVEAPPSTVDTVMAPTGSLEIMTETPVVKKKGKLRQRAQVAAFSDDEDAEEATAMAVEEDYEITANAFDVMRKVTKRKLTVDEFDKKKSDAKNMVHEQADESEDEYAGLGGASDDESGGEADEYVKEMIDDEAGKHVDERQIAAFHADQTRMSDEKQVEKLFNDISKGMLRRKRGADYELSDSDDDVEAQKRRKRAKFAKIQKALLADERVGKLAQNPKQQAFLRAIEDRNSEDEMDFLEDFKEQEDFVESQSQSQSQSQLDDDSQRVPDSQPDASMPPPRAPANPDMRPPPNMRRTKLDKKPTNLSEIRESLSSLIEEPNAMLAPAHSDSESEDGLEIEGGPDDLAPRKEKEKENRDPFALRRTNVAIIDRISLKRQSSSSLSASTRLAFSAASSAQGFKVPPLLRRATTNSSITSDSSKTSSAATERMAGGAGEGIKRGGGKSSGVNFYARESERRAVVVKTEKRREQKKFKGAEARRKVVGGIFGRGKFS